MNSQKWRNECMDIKSSEGAFWSRWRHRQTWLTTSHRHIKTTTKIWNNHQLGTSEIKLNGSLTTTELNKPHPSRLVGGTQTWNGLAPTHVDKNSGGMDILGAKSPRPTPGPPAQDSRARKISPHNFWLQSPLGIESVEEAAGALSSSSWGSHTQTHLLRLMPSEIQHWGGSLKGTSGTQGETEVSGIWASRGYCLFAEPSPHRAGRLVPNLILHLPG